MSENLGKLEDKAIALMRKAATDRLPVDAGLCGQLADVVRDAYQAGERSIVEQVVAAWGEFVGDEAHEGHDDMGMFVDTLTELMEATQASFPMPKTPQARSKRGARAER